MPSSAWLVGTYRLPDQTFTVDATPAPVSAVHAYLRHSTSALSLLQIVQDAIDDTGGPTSTVTILRNRRVRITLNSTADIAWSTATTLRDLLGFSQGDLSGSTTYTAASISPLLWSPGYLATPRTIFGVDGYSVDHQSIYKSDDGTEVYCAHYGSETWQGLEWQHIVPERLRVDDSSDGGGTFHEFWEQCAKLRRRFTYYESISEDDASTSNVTWTTGRGPYVMRAEADGDWFRRNVLNADVSSPLTLPLHQLAELP